MIASIVNSKPFAPSHFSRKSLENTDIVSSFPAHKGVRALTAARCDLAAVLVKAVAHSRRGQLTSRLRKTSVRVDLYN